MALCLGRNDADHCCYIDGVACPHLEENTEAGFRWSCGLRRQLGSWRKVIKSRDWKDTVGDSISAKGYTCETWPNDQYDGCSKCRAKL